MPEMDLTSYSGSLHDHLRSLMKCHGNRISQIDAVTGETLTFAGVLAAAEALAEELSSRGLRAGHVAMILGENSVHYSWVLLGALCTGASAHLVSPRNTKRELAHALELSRPLVLLVSAAMSCSPELAAALQEAGDRGPRHVLQWEELCPEPGKVVELPATACVTGEAALQEQLLPSPSCPSGVALILCSSGTTGLPKGVMLTHRNLLAYMHSGPVGRMVDFAPSDVVLGILPCYHTFGVAINLASMAAGVPVVQVARFTGVTDLLGIMKRHRCSLLFVVPSLLGSLVEQEGFSGAELPALRLIQTGGTALSAAVQAAVRRRLGPGLRLLQAYGLTEGCTTLLQAEARPDKQGFAGLPVQGVQYRIVDPATGREVRRGETGEFCVRGPTFMKGYVSNPEATRENVDADGWLHTGDVAFLDSEGYFCIVDRIKFMFKYNGHQVSPAELEELLCAHPSVREVAVLGVPHQYGEAPAALVVLAEGNSVTAGELEDFLADKIAPHKRLRGGVFFVESLPRNLSGKLQRDRLKTLLDAATKTTEDDLTTIEIQDSFGVTREP